MLFLPEKKNSCICLSATIYGLEKKKGMEQGNWAVMR